tara:strand:- start:788 stop:988 length:201 start_codon:yes stop_codon:yes gene_type:complete
MRNNNPLSDKVKGMLLFSESLETYEKKEVAVLLLLATLSKDEQKNILDHLNLKQRYTNKPIETKTT